MDINKDSPLSLYEFHFIVPIIYVDIICLSQRQQNLLLCPLLVQDYSILSGEFFFSTIVCEIIKFEYSLISATTSDNICDI